MTTLCGGGTSAPKAGYAAIVDFGLGQLVNLLVARNVKWLVPALPLASLPPVTLASFCASDPPAFPTFTGAETDAMLQLKFGADFDSGVSKLKDFIAYTIWNEACECTSGTPTAYPAVTPPTGTPIPITPVAGIAQPCLIVAMTQITRAAGVGPTFSGFARTDASRTPTMGKITSVVTASTGNFNVTIEVRHQTWYSPVTTGHTDSWVQGVGTQTHYFSVDPLYPSWAIYTTGAAGTGQRLIDITTDFYCDGQNPGVTLTPCCPPDEATAATLALILDLVTLQQRQTAPFAYVYGSNHTGLTGDGEISPVSGLLGVSVDVTTLPTSYGRAAGTPEHLFDIGYITLGTADGWLSSRRIDADGTLELAPNGAGALTKIGYSLKPGVVVAIRELVREP